MVHQVVHDLVSAYLPVLSVKHSPSFSLPFPASDSPLISPDALWPAFNTQGLLPGGLSYPAPPPSWTYLVVNSNSSLRYPLVIISWDQCLSYIFLNVSNATCLPAVHSPSELLRTTYSGMFYNPD